MNNTSLKDILSLPNETPIETVQGQIVETGAQRQVRGGKTVQDALLRDGTGAEVPLSVWEHSDITSLKGMEVIIQSSSRGGLKVKKDEYKKCNTISVSRGGTFQKLAVHQAQNGTPLGNVQSQAPIQAPAGNSSGNAGPMNGAKIGMSLNNASLFMTSAGLPYDEDALWKMASSIIRLSERMEKGDIAKQDENKPF